MSMKSAELAEKYLTELVSHDLTVVNNRTVEANLKMATDGVDSLTIGVLARLSSLVSDVTLAFLLFIGLSIVNPSMAFGTAIFFLVQLLVLNKALNSKAQKLTLERRNIDIEAFNIISSSLNSFREISIRGLRYYYPEKLGELRRSTAENQASLAFLPNVSKYVLEASVILGAVIISAIQFTYADAHHAIATLAIFLAAGSRLAPAIMRIQQNFLLVRSNLVIAREIIPMLTKSSLEAGISEVSHTLGQESFKPTISIQNLNFNYKNQKSFRLGEINLEIKEGEFVAIVGPSGAGKTTLIDLLLGIITPSSGQVLISGRPPRESVEKWPGFIGYVPQNVFLANTSILNNIIFEYSTQEPQNDLIESVISKSHLTDFINMLPDGLETQIQNSGNLLSGGQKQRIGIARALYTDPKLLIMDEATSALDSDSEATISSAIRSLRGKMTVIVVAHRLSTIVEADKIYYLDKGKILGSGNFQELRSSLSDFNRQAELMGF